MAAGAVSLRKSHHIIISSYCNIVKCQAKCQNFIIAGRDSTTENGNENETYVKFYIKEEIPVRESFLSCSAVTLLAELGSLRLYCAKESNSRA